jgi:phage replication-related protein YjqB (UPF0714/DUF867 family)
VAPHGGKIESGTSEIAGAIAGREFNLYCFEGIKRDRNYRVLHIASDHFDEPKCLQLVSRSHNVVAIHGCRGFRKVIYVGGRNKTLRTAIVSRLREARLPVREGNHPFPGEGKDNICNRTIACEGVQLELTARLRQSSQISKVVETVREALMVCCT